MANKIGSLFCVKCGKSTMTTVGGNMRYRSVLGMCLYCYYSRYRDARRARNKLLYGNIYGSPDTASRINNTKRCREWISRLKVDVILAYGGRCELCGESIPEFLTIDHTNGDGAVERRQRGASFGGATLYKHLRDLGWPRDRYRLLCYNCNMSRGFAGRTTSGGDNAIRLRYDRLLFKLKVIAAYGGVCMCCSKDDPDILAFDHINGGGNEDRRKHGRTGRVLYKYLRDADYPRDEYQLLCYNCNTAVHRLGYCPHIDGSLKD